jgi:PTH1 family peptidyl-tRNA hydrolase
MVIDHLISRFEITSSLNKKFHSEIAEKKNSGNSLLLVKPQTYMNNSGETVRALIDFYKLSPADILVVHDEKDIILGEYKIQADRSSAGHNGVQSIIDHLGTKNFTRIRIGIGPENKTIPEIENYVMGTFNNEDLEKLQEVIEKVVEEIKRLV